LGLFDKILGKESLKEAVASKKEKKIENLVIETESVANELKNVARSFGVKESSLDFKLLEYKTFMKDNGSEKPEWVEISRESIRELDRDKFLLNQNVLFKQIYKIEVFNKWEDGEEYADINVVLGINRLLTKTVVTVKKSDNVNYSSKLKDYIMSEIDKKKLKAGIMLGMFDEDTEREVQKIVDLIKTHKMLKEDYTFVGCKGIDPVKSINDAIIFHYKKKFVKEDESGKVDHKKRGYALPVDKGEVVIEYVKAKMGSHGRNCQGKFIKVKEPAERYKDIVKVLENIEVKEEEDRILYIAKKSGYVNEVRRHTYDILDEMELNAVNFKSTGSIETGLNTNVRINIKDKSIYNDAVGPGMHLESSQINIQGNVGSGAVLKAKDLKIGGQTHKKSKIYADRGKINVHRGYAEGKEILVNRLEGGKVVADTVKISQAVGGKIEAKKIIIKELMSNSTLMGSALIEVKELKGGNNKFVIDPTIERDFVKKRDAIKKEIEVLKNSLKVLPKKGLEKQAIIDKNRDTVAAMKKKLEEYKKFGHQPPKAFLDKIKKFDKLQESYEKIQNQIKENKLLLEKKNGELKDLQKAIFKAKVIVLSPWTDFNEVIFRLITPPKNITYYPDKGENTKLVMLKPKGDGEDFEIVKRSSV